MITVEDIEEIKQLKHRYCRAIDTKHWADLRSVFSDDCEYAGTATVAAGPDEFVAGVERALGHVITVHQVVNPEIREEGEGRARGSWAMQDYITWRSEDEVPEFLRGSAEQRSVLGFGYYEEKYAKTADGWKIAWMRLTRLAMVPMLDLPPHLKPEQELKEAWGHPRKEWMDGGGYRAP